MQYTSTFDTVLIKMGDDAIKGSMKIPQFIGGGISYSFKDKYLFTSDVTWQNWEKFSSTSQKIL
jgi:long-subunit fatty acid transport protein